MEIGGMAVYGNTLMAWLTGAAVAAGVYVFLRVARGMFTRRLHALALSTSNRLDDLVAGVLKKTKVFFLATLSVYAGSLVLVLPAGVSWALGKAVVISVLLQAAVWASHGITLWLADYSEKKAATDPSSASTMTGLAFIARLALWSIIALLALDNLGVDITALIAGLGIGGIAVALAAQNVLGDLFASLSIVLDKPFVLGDFIVVGDYMGTVEHIGLKTTRLKSLSGEQLVFSNTDLLASRIRNFKRLQERRAVFTFGVTYQTTVEKLKGIPETVRGIIDGIEKTRFDRAHFKGFGDSSLDFEAVYYVELNDYNAYMDIQQEINLDLYSRFEQEGIEFAYPTRTIYVNNA